MSNLINVNGKDYEIDDAGVYTVIVKLLQKIEENTRK